MKLSINPMTPIIPEPTTLFDWVTFFCLASYCFVTTAFSIITVLKYGSYPPLRRVSVRIAMLLVLFGQIHLWATFVANEHFDFFYPVRSIDCALWMYWMQYFVGLNGWTSILIARLFVRSELYELTSGRPRRLLVKSLAFATMVVFNGSLLAICVGVTLDPESIEMENVHTCVTALHWKLALLAWIVLSGIFVLGISLYMERGVPHPYLAEYKPFKHIAIVAGLALCTVAVVSFLGLSYYSIGRSVFTMTVCVMHAFVFCRLFLPHVFRAVIDDKKYSRNMMEGLFSYGARIYDIDELALCEGDMNHFLFWCQAQPSITDTEGNEYAPCSYSACYTEIQTWKKLWLRKLDQTDFEAIKEHIVNEYLSPTGSTQICIDQDIVKKLKKRKSPGQNTFKRVERHVFSFFSKTMWRSYVTEVKATGANSIRGSIGSHEYHTDDEYGELHSLTPDAVSDNGPKKRVRKTGSRTDLLNGEFGMELDEFERQKEWSDDDEEHQGEPPGNTWDSVDTPSTNNLRAAVESDNRPSVLSVTSSDNEHVAHDMDPRKTDDGSVVTSDNSQTFQVSDSEWNPEHAQEGEKNNDGADVFDDMCDEQIVFFPKQSTEIVEYSELSQFKEQSSDED